MDPVLFRMNQTLCPPPARKKIVFLGEELTTRNSVRAFRRSWQIINSSFSLETEPAITTLYLFPELAIKLNAGKRRTLEFE